MNSRMRLSRRGLLQAGLLGSAAVWAGGQLGCAARRVLPALTTQRAALTPAGEQIMRAVIPVVLGPLLPASGAARAQALDVGVANLDDYLAYLSLPLQEEAASVYDTLDLLPTRVLLVGTWSRWGEASPETIESFLRAAHASRFDLLRRMFAFLQSMAVLAWFDQPAAWQEIGYPGPPSDQPAVFGDRT
jgi:hypothetical protein